MIKKVASRKKKRNRRRKEPLARRVARRVAAALRICLALAIVAGLGYGGWRLYEEILTTPRLGVEHIFVRGALRAQPREIIKIAGREEGENIFSFSSGEVAGRVKKNPWVVSAVVRRKLPDTVRIEVVERRPMAIVKIKDLFVMDSKGVIFKKLAPEDRLDLPLVTGLERKMIDAGGTYMESFMRLFSSLESGRGLNLESISEIHCDPVYGFTLYTLDSGLRVELGAEGFERGLGLFERFRAMNRGALRGAVAVDVRKAGEAVVTYDHDVVSKGGGRA